jgi:hypothetical protein
MSTLHHQGKWEIALPDPVLTGGISCEVYEAGKNVEPTCIIQIDQPWGVKVHWFIEGPLKKFICGEWCVTLHFESVGEGDEFNLKWKKEIPLDPCADGKYWLDFKVEPGTITTKHCSALYKVVASVTYRNCGKPGPMAGLCEGPLIQFYEAH